MDYDRMRAQVKKLTDKPDKDVTKLPRAEKDEQLAKAAYDQLNETLTTELPQLIDLRVPYLDPSFEALVKIQLRFCAEAYSRMAQVQQYLDADTRDQYAQGQLDARVEEVLQEIRDLSIAGTVQMGGLPYGCVYVIVLLVYMLYCSMALYFLNMFKPFKPPQRPCSQHIMTHVGLNQLQHLKEITLGTNVYCEASKRWLAGGDDQYRYLRLFVAYVT